MAPNEAASRATEQNDMLKLFMRQAASVGVQVSIADGSVSAAHLIAGMAVPKENPVPKGNPHPAQGPVKCGAAVRRGHPEVFSALQAQVSVVSIDDEAAGGEESRTSLASALAGGVGVVVAAAGVAETGSVVLADNSLAARLLSMLADTCVILLSRSSMLRDLDQAGELIAEMDRRGHRYISLVTGPSRTADIERVLTIGVQGPKALYVILL